MNTSTKFVVNPWSGLSGNMRKSPKCDGRMNTRRDKAIPVPPQTPLAGDSNSVNVSSGNDFNPNRLRAFTRSNADLVNPEVHTLVKFESKYNNFHSRKYISKFRQQNVSSVLFRPLRVLTHSSLNPGRVEWNFILKLIIVDDGWGINTKHPAHKFHFLWESCHWIHHGESTTGKQACF